MQIEDLAKRIALFADQRDWEKFHSPKNLSMALTVESAELLEIFQWLTEKESYGLDREKFQKVKEEVADIFVYLVRLCDILKIDLFEAAEQKIQQNEKKYPIHKSKGNAKKYSEFE